jgi:hypothetical protein
MSIFEFPEYKINIEAESIEEAKKILKEELKAKNIVANEPEKESK